ncbi:hypothetical protein JVU11DRAFT_3170 [Chiua virens]|nr:hypothetical protein JVU11DRAFT_3170 [Chiua virens]
MASERAKVAKDEGNAAFKAGDYPTAIGHYTNAILADTSDYTFFLNRAAAYLKLGKSEDAERDCTKVLALNPNNVKALFRRGQARRALGNLSDAQADLSKAITLEPANESVKNEILGLEKLLQQQTLRQRSKNIAVDAPKITTPKRRRVPIEIVEPDTNPPDENPTVTPSETKDTDLLQPVSSRSLKQENQPTATQAPPSKPRTFLEAKQTREEFQPARVSGGIFRPTGNHTIVTRTPNETPSSAKESSPRSPPSNANASQPTKPPTTLFQFTKSWESLRSDTDKWNLIRVSYLQSQLRLRRLSGISHSDNSPIFHPSIIQVSLEPDLLKSILHAFQVMLEQDSSPDTRDIVRDYLLAFTKVQRFGTVMLFMDKQERQLLELLHEKVNPARS